jgi:hypothetical protein
LKHKKAYKKLPEKTAKREKLQKVRKALGKGVVILLMHPKLQSRHWSGRRS